MSENNTYLDFTEAAKILPNRPHAATLWRWARRGVKVRGVEDRIRLQHVRAGGRILTTRVWIDEFLTSLAQADLRHFSDAHAPIPPPTPKRGQRTEGQRQAAAEAARLRIRGGKP